jgi:hypothetical protein
MASRCPQVKGFGFDRRCDMTNVGIVSRAACRMAAILFAAVMMTAGAPDLGGNPGPWGIVGSPTVEARALTCSDHWECGEDTYCINGLCRACVEDPMVCLDAEFCPYPDECFCDESDGTCQEGTYCLNDGYPADGLGYCGECDDFWHVCPTAPFEYFCSAGGECRLYDQSCNTELDCPLDGNWTCTVWGECVEIH